MIPEEKKKLKTLDEQAASLASQIKGIFGNPPLQDHFHNGFDASPIQFADISRKKIWVIHTVKTPFVTQIILTNTGSYGGGGTSNAFTVTGVLATDIISAVIRASTNSVSINKAVPTANTITVTFSADPGASTTVDFLVSRATAGYAAGFGVFFIAPFDCTVTEFREVHQTAGTDAGAVTLQLERLQGTEALDAGDALLQTALSLKATANTVQTATLTDTTANRALKRGDRLALKDSGTLTDVANVSVVCELQIR